MIERFVFAAALAAASLAAVAQAQPSVTVEFVEPARFADVGDSEAPAPKVQAAYLEELRRALVAYAARRLAPGQSLAVSITEVDMAGRFEPLRRTGGDVRIVRDVYPPRIDLRFRLVDSAGAVLGEGERKLRNPAFLMTTSGYRDDPLRHEKALLIDWVDREFARPAM